MKTTIQDIKRETYRLLNNYLGLGLEEVTGTAERRANLFIQTPDFVNNRVSGAHRKNSHPNKYP